MGTRSLTHIKDGNQTLVTVYRQYDGYPEGHGAELLEIIEPRAKIENGVIQASFNGAGEMAAVIVAGLKTGDNEKGNVYIYPPNSKDCGEEFVYVICAYKKQIRVRVTHWGTFYFGGGGESDGKQDVLFDGGFVEYKAWIKKLEEKAKLKTAQ